MIGEARSSNVCRGQSIDRPRIRGALSFRRVQKGRAAGRVLWSQHRVSDRRTCVTSATPSNDFPTTLFRQIPSPTICYTRPFVKVILKRCTFDPQEADQPARPNLCRYASFSSVGKRPSASNSDPSVCAWCHRLIQSPAWSISLNWNNATGQSINGEKIFGPNPSDARNRIWRYPWLPQASSL